MKIKINVLLFFTLFFISLVMFNYYEIMTVTNLAHKELVIIGTTRFKNQIAQALILLNEKAPEAYDMVNEYVGRIEQNERSGMVAYKMPPTINLADRTTYYSLTWCASVIAHEAFHSKLYHDYKKKHPWRFWSVPQKVWAWGEGEKKCMKYQLEVLKQFNAPINEIIHVAMGDGTHGDLNGDGKLDWSDYWLSDW